MSAQLSTLHRLHPSSELLTQNLAVCLLYTGEIERANQLLESLVDEGQNFPALLFNLATVYELRSERARERKVKLAERVAGHGHEEGAMGCERNGADFKLS